MKKIIFSFAIVFFTLCTYGQPGSEKDIKKEEPVSGLPYCLSQSDAQKILGQPVKLIESSSEVKNNVLKHRCTYTPAAADTLTSKPCNLYYVIEQYTNTASAKKAYADIVSNNRDMPGQIKINNLGDEAFLHTDEKNFDLVMFRKNEKILRMKVNRITNTTSLEELQNVAGKIALKL